MKGLFASAACCLLAATAAFAGGIEVQIQANPGTRVLLMGMPECATEFCKSDQLANVLIDATGAAVVSGFDPNNYRMVCAIKDGSLDDPVCLGEGDNVLILK